MSSVLRTTRDSTNLKRQFQVTSTDMGVLPAPVYFNVSNNTLTGFISDLSGVSSVIARDIGVQAVVNNIDPSFLSFITDYQNSTMGFSENFALTVVRPGIARKFQVLSVEYTNKNITSNPNDIGNDLFVLGDASNSTISGNSYEVNLPYTTFWAITDPLVFTFIYSNSVYKRAVQNTIQETTFLG